LFNALFFIITAVVHAVAWVGFLNPFLSGPSGSPRENLSLIEAGLTGLLSWAPSIFIPENRPGLRLSLGG
jgi:hypothetical protein